MKHRFIVKDMLCARCEQSIPDAVKRCGRRAIGDVGRANDLVIGDSIEPRDVIVIASTEEGYTVA